MAGSWTDWMAQINRTQKIDTVVYLGAGYGADLPDLLARTRAERMVLVEPNPVFLPTLDDLARGDSRVQVMPVALSDTVGPAPFHVFNVAAHSSLHAPTGLRDLFPGLREDDTPMVERLTLEALLDEIDLAPKAVHVLIADLPGDAGLVVTALADREDAPFAHVLLCTAAETLYDTVPVTKGLHQKLIPGGFRLADLQMQERTFPRYWMRFDKVHAERARLAGRVAELGASHNALEQANKTMTQRIERMQQDQYALRKEHTQISAQLDAGRQDVAMSLRLSALQEATIEDLRRRHAELQAHNAALTDVLRAVAARLAQDGDSADSGAPSGDTA